MKKGLIFIVFLFSGIQAFAQTPINVALVSAGATATASSFYNQSGTTFPRNNAIQGDRKDWGASVNGWASDASKTVPQWLEVDFPRARTLAELDTFEIQDNFSMPVNPTLSTTCMTYCNSSFLVQTWDGSQWNTIPNGSITGNTHVWNQFSLLPTITTSKIRYYVTATHASDGLVRLVDFEAYYIHPAGAQTFTALTCNNKTGQFDVAGASGLALDGDTVNVPAGTCKWDTTLNVSQSITLSGAGSSSTIIQDGTANNTRLINWTCSAGSANRLTGFGFADGGVKTSIMTLGALLFMCTDATGTTLRIDHNSYDHLKGFQNEVWNAIGVVDHNTFSVTNNPSGEIPLYGFHASWQGVGGNGENSWAQPTNFGSSQFLFYEDNTVTFDVNESYACWDNFRGFRGVARFNKNTRCSYEDHGTESSGYDRGVKAVEVYANSFDGSNSGGQILNKAVNLRGGQILTWGNKGTNIPIGFTYSSVTLVDDRSTSYFTPWGEATGRNIWDKNNGSDPFPITNGGSNCAASGGKVCTAASGGRDTVTVTGARWTTNQWLSSPLYVIRKINCAFPPTKNCSALIVSNTATTITFAGAGFNGDLTFTTGDTFEINKVTQTIDQPGAGEGSLVPTSTCTATSSGTSATASGCSTTYSNGQVLSVSDDGNATSYYNGTFTVTASGGNSFTYTCLSTCGSSTSLHIVTPPPGFNDQIIAPVYSWNNPFTFSDTTTSEEFVSVSTSAAISAIENTTFFSYGGSPNLSGCNTMGNPHNPCPFTGTPGTNNGIGIGKLADRPTTCTPGVGYWAPDLGNWNSTNDARAAYVLEGITYYQGVFYKCTAPNTWTLSYTPYTYPHPLTMNP